MGLAAALEKGKYIGVRALRETLADVVKDNKKTFFLTQRGKPVKAVLPYEMFLELMELLDELKDERLLQRVAEGRKEYKKEGWIPFEKLKKDLSL